MLAVGRWDCRVACVLMHGLPGNECSDSLKQIELNIIRSVATLIWSWPGLLMIPVSWTDCTERSGSVFESVRWASSKSSISTRIFSPFFKSFALNQRSLILIAILQYHSLKKEKEIVKNQLQCNRLNNYTEEIRFRMQEPHWLRHGVLSTIVSDRRLKESYGNQPSSSRLSRRSKDWDRPICTTENGHAEQCSC